MRQGKGAGKGLLDGESKKRELDKCNVLAPSYIHFETASVTDVADVLRMGRGGFTDRSFIRHAFQKNSTPSRELPSSLKRHVTDWNALKDSRPQSITWSGEEQGNNEG